jgi:hypothetical protein
MSLVRPSGAMWLWDVLNNILFSQHVFAGLAGYPELFKRG